MYPLLGWTDRVRPRPAYLVFLIVSTTFGTASATRALGAPSASEAQAASPAAAPAPAGMPLALEDAVRRANEVSALVRRARAESRRDRRPPRRGRDWMPANPGVAFALGQQRDVANDRADLPGSATGCTSSRRSRSAASAAPASTRSTRAVDAADARERLAGVEARRARAAPTSRRCWRRRWRRSTAERETLAARLEDSVRARVDAGAASEIELRLAEVERGRMHRERVDAERLAGEARAELLALLALPPADRRSR